MGLIGRLEDLPIADILQIVYLSRGSGRLDVRHEDEHFMVLFQRGLILNASSPYSPSLRSHLEKKVDLAPLSVHAHQGMTIGASVLEMNLISEAELAKLILEHVTGVITPLCAIRSGEFQFTAADPTPEAVEYDAERLFRHGGIRPESILGKAPVRLRTLGGVKESIEAGKRAASPAVLAARSAAAPLPGRPVVLFENDAAIRDAVGRTLTARGFDLIDRKTTAELLKNGLFFVTVLDVDSPDARQHAWPLVDQIKSHNPRLPVLILDRESDFRRRHSAFQAGADLYLTKPNRSGASLMEEEWALFAEDVAMFAEKKFAERDSHNLPTNQGDTDQMYRGFRLLMQLINEVSDPNDISQLTLTILQLAADFFDRGVLFVARGNEFVAVGKFGLPGVGGAALRLRRGDLPLFNRVIESRKPCRGGVDSDSADWLRVTLGGQIPSETLLLPMVNENEVIAVLYGDNAIHAKSLGNTAGLEIFLAEAGSLFQNAIMSTSMSASKQARGNASAIM